MRKIIIAMLCLLSFTGVLQAQEQPPAKVVVTRIDQQEVAESRPFIGGLYYDRKSEVSVEFAGLVESILVREGDMVGKGDVLVQLDTAILDEEISLKKKRIEQINLSIAYRKKNYQRLEGLYARDAVSQKSLEDALYEYEDLIKEKQAVEKELEKLLIQKRKSTIKAPFAGVILEKTADTGAWVNPGSRLVVVGSKNDMYVRVPVAETILRHITPGRKVVTEITAFAREVPGTIKDIDPVADEQTKNVFLKVRIAFQPDVAENLSVIVHVPVSENRRLSIIPRDALVKFQGGDFVYTVKDGKAAIMPVNIVAYMADSFGADNPGLQPGMPIVIEGNERLRPDQPVVIAEEK